MHPFFTERVCRNQKNHSRASVSVIAETTTDLCSFKIPTPSSNLLALVLPGAWGKVRKDRSWKFPPHTLHLCCGQKEFYTHILLQVKVPNKVTVRRSLQACTQSPRAVLLRVTGARGYGYKTVDGKDFWSSQTWPWFEPVLWISSLSFKQPSLRSEGTAAAVSRTMPAHQPQ